MALEIRWFFQQTVPPDVLSWFTGKTLGNIPPDNKERTDYYLLSSDTGIGIKLREGKLEIKWRRKQGVFDRPDAKVYGKPEDWEKWSWKDIQGKSDKKILDMIAQQKKVPWIQVKKERWQRKYGLRGNKVVNVPMDSRPEHGCMAELTKLSVMDAAWWTFALDLFGAEKDAIDTLGQWLSISLKDYPGPELRNENSFGYPEWIINTGSRRFYGPGDSPKKREGFLE